MSLFGPQLLGHDVTGSPDVFRVLIRVANLNSRHILASKESAKERRCFIRDAGDLVRCLTIKFEIELGLRPTVVPVGKKFELAPPQAPPRQRVASDRDADARRLPGDPAFSCNRFGRGDDAAGDETWPAFVLAREDEDRIAFGDVLATIHRLLRFEDERLRRRIADLSFDREHHTLKCSVYGNGKPNGPGGLMLGRMQQHRHSILAPLI